MSDCSITHARNGFHCYLIAIVAVVIVGLAVDVRRAVSSSRRLDNSLSVCLVSYT
jgi:hypothetical protein